MRRDQASFLLGACLVATPIAAQADMGLPLVAVFLPPMWLALIPVILIEAWVIKRLTQIGFRNLIVPVTIGNLLSTLVGIPVAWVALAVLEGICCDGVGYGGTIGSKIFAVTAQSPWLMPEAANRWQLVVAALLFFSIPMFAVSVWIEAPINKALVKSAEGREWKPWKVTAIANLASYSCLALLIWPISKLPRSDFFYGIDVWLIETTAGIVKLLTGK